MDLAVAQNRALPGWIRLWFLLVVVWLTCVAAYFTRDFPSEQSVGDRKRQLNEFDLQYFTPKSYAHTHCAGVEGTMEYGACLTRIDYAREVAAYRERGERLASEVRPYVEEHLGAE